MDPGAPVQHAIDRCPTQAGGCNNFGYTYASLNIHYYWQVRAGGTQGV
jgi:hypothetical protein